MSTATQKEKADRHFADALASSGARDPRDFYRSRLRDLRAGDEAAFHKAVDYFETVLVPAVASDDSDPLGEWLDYGCYLAALMVPGAVVQIDPSGRSSPYTRPVPSENLVLHLPTSTRDRALAVGLPPRLSAAQRATFTLLVKDGDDPEES
ncbi:hypothetical protein BH23GEM6_BH23GEM6_27230 [soil metagenome]